MTSLSRYAILLATCMLASTSLQAEELSTMPRHQCSAQAAKFLEGQPFTEDQPERARQAAGASEVRVLTQGQFITKEYKMGRLNITVDDNRRIVLRVHCG